MDNDGEIKAPTMDSEGDHTDWLPTNFKICTSSEEYITGIVSSEEELKHLLENHKRASGTSYTVWSDDSHKKQKVTPRCLWKVEDYSEHVPLSVKRRVIYACQHGKNYKTTTTDDLHTEHDYRRRKRFHIQNSKKVDCPAKLYVRYVERYDQFAVAKTSSRTEKQVAIKGVLESLKENSAVTSEIIHVKIPLAGAHKNHNTSRNCHFSNNIHYMVRDKIQEYVSLGITSVPFLKKVLKTFVQKELSGMGSFLPHPQDPSYYPSSHVIQNHVHQALVCGKYSGFDQLQVEKKIDEWKLTDPNAKFFFRKCTENNIEQTVLKFEMKAEEQGFPGTEDSDLEGNNTHEITSSQETFLFIHQNVQQQELLKRYGDMVLLDATYRTTKYALPLFLVVVRTNVGYKPIAEFICEKETTAAITEALNILKQWNQHWEPQFFMLDYSQQEYQALKRVFLNSQNYLCSFHREQAWIRWTKQAKNKLSLSEQNELLNHLRDIASAPSEASCDREVERLKESKVYKSLEVKNYVDRRWLCVRERWCRAYAPHGFSVAVTTNNGVEALNKSLKSFYLKFSGTGSLSSLLETLICEFVPEQLLSYSRLNFIYSSECKTYNPAVPAFLKDRPRNFVKHCLNSIKAASSYSKEHVKVLGKESFHVKSETTSTWYKVELGDSEKYPSCECVLFKTTFLPCKHFFAIFRHTDKKWVDLSPEYRQSPYITLDFNVALTQDPQSNEISNQEDLCFDVFDSPVPCTGKQKHGSESQSPNVAVDQWHLREQLKTLHDISYICTDKEAIKNASRVVHGLCETLKSCLPKEEGLVLQQQEPAKKNLRALPSRLKKVKQKTSRKRKTVAIDENEEDADIHKKSKTNIPEFQRTEDTEMDKNSVQACGVDLSKEDLTQATSMTHGDPCAYLSHSEHLPRLSEDMESEVKDILALQDPNLVISKAFKLCITQGDLATLKEGCWLNDKVINFYLSLLMKRNSDQLGSLKVFFFSTFFYSKLQSGEGHAGVKNWTKTQDLFLFDLIFVPLHLGMHWALAVIDLKSQTIQCYDSMSQRHDEICHMLFAYLTEEHRVKKGYILEASRWTIGRMRTFAIPKQLNGNDCGVFVCKYADFLSQGKLLTFRQDDIPLFRKVMVWEIVHQKIL
ncbi:uncharacterized protein [Misgurnus anguillicaudatus]|uniref:uncharacterized protein n=1 Tax=Misgurnus anguillicaudatus TaxID=75329 RepID=UPI003CCF1F55